MTDELVESARAIANSNGKAVVTLGPYRAFERWDCRSITVLNTSTTNEPTAKVYRGAEDSTRLMSATYSGRQDTDSELNVKLQAGEQLVIVWENADVSSESVATINGERFGR